MINNTERFCRAYPLLGILLLICIFCSSNAFAAAGMLIIVKDGPDAYVFLVRDRDDEHFEIPSGKNEKAANLNDMTKILESNYETAL
ncbi:MAG: hypothetical protein GY710_18785, partial [Desulfobacteraceae bacterium]|nr:hypothetical protein [Desulfobacteraceae bacterium]